MIGFYHACTQDPCRHLDNAGMLTFKVERADNGEGPPDKDAKEKAKKVLDDPAHRKPKGSPEDERTRDDPQKEND